jgi:hypothetical protein
LKDHVPSSGVDILILDVEGNEGNILAREAALHNLSDDFLYLVLPEQALTHSLEPEVKYLLYFFSCLKFHLVIPLFHLKVLINMRGLKPDFSGSRES